MTLTVATPLARTTSPGFSVERLALLCARSVQRCGLRLDGRVIVTEAATGAYSVTAVLAAMAGAEQVRAVASDSPYGSAEDAMEQVDALARTLGVERAIEFVPGRADSVFDGADIVTNSGHVRPIDQRVVSSLRPGAVVSLMYEDWELRADEVDVNACLIQGVHVAGVNENHPNVDVFAFLGLMAVKQLLDAGVSPLHSEILLLCDNAFAPHIAGALRSSGARVRVAAKPDESDAVACDAIVIAMQPQVEDVISAAQSQALADSNPGAVVVQFWGDIDRDSMARAGLMPWPQRAPGRGHMAVLPSTIGPDPIVRLQTGGLKVGEVLTSGRKPTWAEETYLQRVV